VPIAFVGNAVIGLVTPISMAPDSSTAASLESRIRQLFEVDMHPDMLLIVLLAGLGGAAIPMFAWLRAAKRIRDLEMTLLAQTTDADRYEELRGLLQQIALQSDNLADTQARLVGRLTDGPVQLPPSAPMPSRPVTPH
jgi:hypothetical protein